MGLSRRNCWDLLCERGNFQPGFGGSRDGVLSWWAHSTFPMPLDAMLHRPPEEDPLHVATRHGSRRLPLGFPEHGRLSVFLGELRREVLRPCGRRRRTAVGLVIEPNRLPLTKGWGAGPHVDHYIEDGAADEGDVLRLARRGRRIGDPAKRGASPKAG